MISERSGGGTVSLDTPVTKMRAVRGHRKESTERHLRRSVTGVYFTVYMANRNYREDARNRILPYIAIDVINNIQPDPFLEGVGSEEYSSMGNAPIIEESINGKANNHLFFVIDGTSKIRASESFHEDEAEKAKRTSVMWIRAEKDGKMYLRESACISMPFLVKNIGNGPAKKLRMAFSCQNRTPFFKTEIIFT